MANKLAGQRAKFSRARAIYYSSGDEDQRRRAVQLMAEVISQAPGNGFMEEDVTQGEDVPDEVRRLPFELDAEVRSEDPDEQIAALLSAVDASRTREIGVGAEFVYAYAYACAPDRLKVGSTRSDVVARVAAQIGTGTPDRPILRLQIRTHDCRTLERLIHNYLRYHRRKVDGAGAEWFIVSLDELVEIYSLLTTEAAPAA